MDTFPPELLHNIFIPLDLKQRLICTRVSRNWWYVLYGCSLFYDVHMKKAETKFNRYIDMFKRPPGLAAQVEELDIEVAFGTRFNRRELLYIFPNARVMSIEPYQSTLFSDFSHFATHIDTAHSKLESLSDFNHCELASQMLYSNLGGRLKTLCLNFEVLPDMHQRILSQLKNLPVLKRLSLKSPRIKLSDLENIHNNIPSIQEFSLVYLYLEVGDMPSNIISDASITKFELNAGGFPDADAHIQFYQYMTQKYTKITNIKHRDEPIHRYSSSTRKEIYLNGVLGFFKRIGLNQGEVALTGLPKGVNPFEAFDTMDSRIMTLYFRMCEDNAILHYLSQSNQSKCIKEWGFISTRIDSLRPIKDLTVLTRLSLEFYRPHFYM
ncbi:hypothetical protein K501DRAFT_275137 [Backusella circina FSU 941]|nr:hypothetical protein K501DRAFT_275137 [Backusella circina FSU 941]